MTTGIAAASANSALDTWLNSSFAQLHTGDPGSAGTANVSSTTTRNAPTYSSATGGSKALSSGPTWAAWTGTNGEVVSHISLWSASTGGTFKDSFPLTATKTINTGDVFSLSTHTVSMSPIAA